MRYELIVGYNAYRPIYTAEEHAAIQEVKRTADQYYKTAPTGLLTAQNRAQYELVKTFDGYDPTKIDLQKVIDRNYPDEAAAKVVEPETMYGEGVDLADPAGIEMTIAGVAGTWSPAHSPFPKNYDNASRTILQNIPCSL